MEINDLLIEEKDTICKSVSVCLTKKEFERWLVVKKKLLLVNKKAHIQKYSRDAIKEMLDNLERLLSEYDFSNTSGL